MRILAIDDEPFIRELLPNFTAKAGYPDVETAESGAAALRLIADSDEGFDCILLDISMPKMDGIETCRRIRSLPGYARTPIIMLTAMVDKNFVNRAFEAGATDYATKPFDLTDLGTRLNAAEATNDRYAKTGAEPAGHLNPTVPLTDSSDLADRRRLLDTPTFRNYLTQMSRDTLSQSQVFAVTIEGFDTTPGQPFDPSFPVTIGLIDNTLTETLHCDRFFMTYTGGGTVVVVSDRTGFKSVSQFQSDVQFLLDDRYQKGGQVPSLPLNISVGRPIRLNADNVANVEKLFEQASFLAQQCTVSKTKKTDPISFLLRKLSIHSWRGK